MRVKLSKQNGWVPWSFATLHLLLCVVTFAYLLPASEWGLAPILMFDFPVSGIFANSANSDAVMISEFAVLGTLWWFLLSYAVARVLELLAAVVGWMFRIASSSSTD